MSEKIFFYDTLQKKKLEFVPLKDNEVKLYTCGPTVYDYAHIGNFRTYVFEDLLRRVLKFYGYEVYQVMNITDVEDKTIQRALERGIPLDAHTKPFTDAFFEDLDTLNIEHAELYPTATAHVSDMIAMIQKLLDKGFAYEQDGSVYFSISNHEKYGKLSGMKLDNLKKGVRINTDEYTKDDPRDFALWKAWTEDDGDVVWDSPFGKGRPGWHIECSAMSMKYLGETFDIHTGGEDNIFPHHENEIAQSECATGRQFVRYWLHSKHLLVNGEKMSKSAGNFYTLRDLLDKGYSPRLIRYMLIGTHYRQQLNFSEDLIEAAKASIARLDTLYNLAHEGETDGEIREEIKATVTDCEATFKSALFDDLNISGAMAGIFDFVSAIHRLNGEQVINRNEGAFILENWKKFDEVLGFLIPKRSGLPEGIKNLVKNRLVARKDKNWAESDKIRDELTAKGYQLEDKKEETIVVWSQGREKVN